MSETAASQAIVDLDAYVHNLGVVRRFVGDQAGIMAVVKANAYGHGLETMARKACDAGVRMLGVAAVDEGIALRAAGVDTPILVLMQPELKALGAIIEHGLRLMVSDVATAEQLGEMARRANRVVPVHCKVDSGMGRQGFPLKSAAQDLQYLTRISHIDIEGVATHFPVADKLEDTFTYNQIKTFRQLLKAVNRYGIPYEMAHAANSAAIVNYQGSIFDMVRPGLITYGVWPTEYPPAQNLLKPVLRWETHITQIRELEAGASVGYGRTYTAPAPIKVALLPIGYADGYKHALSNRGEVLIGGTRCPVRGSVCMDQIVAEVTHLPNVQAGDVATLIGSDGEETITAEELARKAGTIPYDILTGIGPRVPRVYTGG